MGTSFPTASNSAGRTAVDDTNVNTDTNGDGVKNFQPDLDPPIYNTTDNS